jgi:hypothetical protein
LDTLFILFESPTGSRLSRAQPLRRQTREAVTHQPGPYNVTALCTCERGVAYAPRKCECGLDSCVWCRSFQAWMRRKNICCDGRSHERTSGPQHSRSPRNRININSSLVTAVQCEEAGCNFSGVPPVWSTSLRPLALTMWAEETAYACNRCGQRFDWKFKPVGPNRGTCGVIHLGEMIFDPVCKYPSMKCLQRVACFHTLYFASMFRLRPL